VLDDVLSTPPPPADLLVRYGLEREQFAELRFTPEGKTSPLAINIHGGFWRARYDLAHAGHFCAALAARGINTANIEYRRAGWPRTLEDIRAAYRYLRKHAAELEISAAPAVVVGHSAGGQLALCLAANESSLRYCISLAGVLDLRRAFELHLGNGAVAEYLGGAPSHVPEHYRAASPMELAIPGARQLIVHGLADDVVPAAISLDYAAAKQKRGERVEYLALPEAGHLDVIDPRSEAFAKVGNAVLRLLRE
jgi:acetyl esterase/lipase